MDDEESRREPPARLWFPRRSARAGLRLALPRRQPLSSRPECRRGIRRGLTRIKSNGLVVHVRKSPLDLRVVYRAHDGIQLLLQDRPRELERETLCVGSKVKAYIKANGMKCSGDLIEALSNSMHEHLDSAITRCQGNKRSTVRPVDL